MADDRKILTGYVNNNYDKSGIDNLTKFMGYNPNVYLDPAVNGYAFIFVTKPSLFLYPQKPTINDNERTLAYENMCSDSKFTSFLTEENSNKKDQLIIKQLSYFEFADVESLFLPIFTNMTKSFTPGDLTLDTIEAFRNRDGFFYTLPKSTTMSEASSTISLSVTETDNLDFLKMLTLWVNYIKNISNGTFIANSEMIRQNMIDYMSSIYFFVVGPDGRTLKYWSRYTGAYPTAVPYSSLGYNKGSINHVELDVPFTYTFKEEMDPRILEDFNIVSLGLVSPELFMDNSYDDFIKETEVNSNNGYDSFINSKLLDKQSLFTGSRSSIVKESNRNPVVYYQQVKSSNSVSQDMDRTYVLSFGKDTIKNDLFNSIIDDDDAFSYSELNDDLS